jgi:uncharacterized iron-regulated protein
MQTHAIADMNVQANSRFSAYLARLPLLCCLVLVSCGEPASSGQDDRGAFPTNSAAQSLAQLSGVLDPQQETAVRDLLATYLEQADADFVTSRGLLQDFSAAVTGLLDAPNSESLAAAQSAWLDAYSAYEATLLHRYFAELVLPQQAYLNLVDLNFRINQWPIFPGYLDAVDNYPDSGLVFDPSVPLDRSTLVELHGQFDLAEAAMGFHVLEFLLWGEAPLSRNVDDFRQVTVLTEDHIEAGLTLQQLPRNRRRQLLQVTTDSLLTDFEATYQIWSQGIQSYQQRIDATNSAVLVSQLLTAINAMLTEELLVRSLYPLLNGDYVDSLQSRFSGETQRAIVSYITSVERLLLDTNTSDGVRLAGIFGELSDDFNELFYQNFDASKECLVVLYSSLEVPQTPEEILATEFEIVECINLLTNMIDYFNRIDRQLQGV